MTQYNQEELVQMTKSVLIKHITDLYAELQSLEKPKNRVYLGGTPKYVREYMKEVKRDE